MRPFLLLKALLLAVGFVSSLAAHAQTSSPGAVLRIRTPAREAAPAPQSPPRTVTRIKYVPVVKVKTKTVYVKVPVAAPVAPGYRFFDDFSDASHNWCSETNELGSFTLQNGKYTVQSIKESNSKGCMVPTELDNNQDFTCSVAVQWKDGITNNGFGLKFCGNAARDSWYHFMISANGYFIVSYTDHQHNSMIPVLPWTMSKYVYQNSVPNILSVQRRGIFVRFFINESEVGAVPFDGGFGNRFGVSVEDSQTVAFDNFIITGSRKP